MRITCPQCGFSKDLPRDAIPAEATTVCCPSCRGRFALPSGTALPADRPDAPAAPQHKPAAVARTRVLAVPKAGFWIRVVAALIDTLIVVTLQFSLGFLIGLAGFFSTGQLGGNVAILVQLFGYALSFAYYVVFTGHGGQTPGKMALRIKVVRCDGSEIGYGRAAFREIPAKFLSALILCIGYLMVAFDEQKQGLHDRMADTYVIKL